MTTFIDYAILTHKTLLMGVFLTGDNMATKNKSQVNERIMLACTECKERNYATTKNKRNNPERIELMKFCPKCGKRTLHKETK